MELKIKTSYEISMLVAAHEGHLKAVEALLAAAANPDGDDGCKGDTPLHAAADEASFF